MITPLCTYNNYTFSASMKLKYTYHYYFDSYFNKKTKQIIIISTINNALHKGLLLSEEAEAKKSLAAIYHVYHVYSNISSLMYLVLDERLV